MFTSIKLLKLGVKQHVADAQQRSGLKLNILYIVITHYVTN